MAFTLDRNEAAKRLGVSTRTIDRHIQNEKIRTRRIGKKMFLEEDDVEALREADPARREDSYEVLEMEEPIILHEEEILPIVPNMRTEISAEAKMAITEFSRIYNDAQGLIAQKDETIKDLSYKVGKLETELQNSINVVEYRRAADMLEHTKMRSEEETKNFGQKISTLEKEVQKKNSFIVGMVILFVLVIISTLVFVFYSRFL